jgi:hypothetical protein
MEHALAQEWKARPAIALSFDQFQLGHVSLHHAVIDPPGETSSHRVFVFLNPSRKGLEFGNLAAFDLVEPGIEALGSRVCVASGQTAAPGHKPDRLPG